MNEVNDKVTKARDLLLQGDLDGADYRNIKNDCERQISILEGKLVDLSKSDNGLSPLLDKALKNISRLLELYQTADSQRKRHIISSMYPGNLTFDGMQHRTNRINEAIRVFSAVKAVFEGKKEGKSSKKLDLPVMVAGNRSNCRPYGDESGP